MILKNRVSGDKEFNSPKELYEYIISGVINNIKLGETPNFDKVSNYFDSTKSITTKKFISDINSIFYSKTILNVRYWIDRGWSPEQSIVKISDEQSKRSHKLIKQKLKLKDENYEEWCKGENTHIEFYLNKGLSIEDAKISLKERQSTFTLSKCIEKYGYENGNNVWTQRQIRWNSKMRLKKNMNHDSNSIKYYKDLYGDNWEMAFVDKQSYSDNIKICLRDILLNNYDLDKMTEYLSDALDVKCLVDLRAIYTSKLIQNRFRLSSEELRLFFINKLELKITYFGTTRVFNNHICKSNGEYEIAKFLYDNNIKYIYEKRYPDSRNIVDFYLIDKDIYLEYMGLSKISKSASESSKYITNKYIEKYKLKEKLCIENNINYYFNSDILTIIKYIKNEYNIN